MGSEHLVEITDANYEQEVLQSDVPVMVDLWAEWCGPCRLIAPIVDELAEEYAGKVKVGKLDVDSNRQTATKLSIQAIPTLLLFKDGQVVKKIVGVQAKKDLKAALEELLG